MLISSIGRRAALVSTLAALAPRPPASAVEDQRARLLAAISDGGDVESALASLLPLDPSRGKAALAPELAGEWRLLWSAKTEAFSPLLALPRPVRPASFQLLGDSAAREVGSGRVAQVLKWGAVEQVLSPGVEAAPDDASVLEIYPPFRLELGVRGLGKLKLILQRAGDDSMDLPTAHTCFNMLTMPEYGSRAKLRDRLTIAIHNATGFGLQ